MKFLKTFIIFFIAFINIYSNEIINLQYASEITFPIIKISSNDLKPNTPNPFAQRGYTKEIDHRFINKHTKEKGVHISKKTIRLNKNENITWKIKVPLLHSLKTEPSDGFKLEWNGKKISAKKIMTKGEGELTITATREIEFQEAFLFPLEKKEFQPDVFFIVIDSLRKDAVEDPELVPNLTAFSKDSSFFEKHFVNSSWTRPSTMVFLTGLYPARTPVNIWDYPVFPDERQSFYNSNIITLPSILASRGYRTIMIGNNPFLTDKLYLGVDTGFEEVYEYSNLNNDTPLITQKFLIELENHKEYSKRPVFVFLNYNDPHRPYTPPPEFLQKVKNRNKMDEKKANYLGEVSFVDSELTKVFGHLKKFDSYNESIIIITSDHGEVMHPAHAKSRFNGVYTLYGHGQGLYDEDIHVPLWIKSPLNNYKNKKIPYTSRSIDLYPTILDLANIDIPEKLDGESLVPFLSDKEKSDRIYYGEGRGVKAIREGNWKLQSKTYEFHRPGPAWNGSGQEKEEDFLFNLKTDPQETKPIENEEKIIIKLKEKFLSFMSPSRVFGIRIHPGEKSRNVQLRFSTKLGKIVTCNEKGIEQEYPGWKNTYSVITFSKEVKNKTEEIFFKLKPDYGNPGIEITVDGKEPDREEIGFGEKDIYLKNCIKSLKSCEGILNSRKPPRISEKFRIQIWALNSKKKTKESNELLEKEAIEILKKQGYVK